MRILIVYNNKEFIRELIHKLKDKREYEVYNRESNYFQDYEVKCLFNNYVFSFVSKDFIKENNFGSSFYCNKIYCTNDVDDKMVYDKLAQCIRFYNPLEHIGFYNHFDFKDIEWEEFERLKKRVENIK